MIILKIFSIIDKFKSKINNYILSFIPSYITACYYLNNDIVYSLNPKSVINYKNIYEDEYYIINIWNRKTVTNEYYYVKAKILYNIYKKDEVKINDYLYVLEDYINKNKIDDDIFHIEINQEDCNKSLYKYKNSLLLNKNATASSIYMLNFISNHIIKNMYICYNFFIYNDINIKIIDYNLNDKYIKNNEYVINQCVEDLLE
jgi:hypothetical protein